MNVFLPGGAGLVGLNLIALLRQQHPEWELLVVEEHLVQVVQWVLLVVGVHLVHQEH